MKLFATFAATWLLASAALAQDRFAAMPEPTLSPRYYLAASPMKPLAKRQAVCAAKNHPCDDIGAPGVGACCPDDTYCYVNPNDQTKAACCAIGSICDSKCDEDRYQCNSTATVTSGASTTTSIVAACCKRSCSTSSYACPSSLGSGCCPYGQVCGNKVCLSTSTASTSVSGIVTQIPEGCTTSQIACAASIGGGCCANTQVCTSMSGGAKCAPATITPTASGIVRVENNDLSTGAKAGISVGVVAAAAIIIGAVTWWCLRLRRSRSQAASSNRHSMPQIVGGGGRAMTETNSDVNPQGAGSATGGQDYFAGPYTDPTGTEAASVGTSAAAERGVPVDPYGPGDIAAPVEIDSRASPGMLGPEDALSQGTRSNRSSVMHTQQVPNTIDGRFELYGDDPAAIPYVPSPSTESPQMETPLEHPLSPQSPESPLSDEVFATPLTQPPHHQYGSRDQT